MEDPWEWCCGGLPRKPFGIAMGNGGAGRCRAEGGQGERIPRGGAGREARGAFGIRAVKSHGQRGGGTVGAAGQKEREREPLGEPLGAFGTGGWGGLGRVQLERFGCKRPPGGAGQHTRHGRWKKGGWKFVDILLIFDVVFIVYFILMRKKFVGLPCMFICRYFIIDD